VASGDSGGRWWGGEGSPEGVARVVPGYTLRALVGFSRRYIPCRGHHSGSPIHTYIYIYIYICTYTCACVCVLVYTRRCIRDVLYIIYNILFTPIYSRTRAHACVPCVNAHGCERARACNPTHINRFGNAVYVRTDACAYTRACTRARTRHMSVPAAVDLQQRASRCA